MLRATKLLYYMDYQGSHMEEIYLDLSFMYNFHVQLN